MCGEEARFHSEVVACIFTDPGGGLMSTLPKTSTNSFLENLSFTREVGCSGIQGKLTTNVKKTGTKLFSVPQMLSFGGVSFSGVSP